LALAVLAIALAAHAASPTSVGFVIPGTSSGPPKMVCATNLPHRADGLYCASALIEPHTYDQLGVLKLSSAGKVTIVRSGSDILFAIDGNLDRGRPPRPTLSIGHTWRAHGYRCARTTAAVRCRRGSHGFVLTTRLRVF
jgi:hypothetical protein